MAVILRPRRRLDLPPFWGYGAAGAVAVAFANAVAILAAVRRLPALSASSRRGRGATDCKPRAIRRGPDSKGKLKSGRRTSLLPARYSLGTPDLPQLPLDEQLSNLVRQLEAFEPSGDSLAAQSLPGA